jgi:hypothetical protein
MAKFTNNNQIEKTMKTRLDRNQPFEYIGLFGEVQETTLANLLSGIAEETRRKQALLAELTELESKVKDIALQNGLESEGGPVTVEDCLEFINQKLLISSLP